MVVTFGVLILSVYLVRFMILICLILELDKEVEIDRWKELGVCICLGKSKEGLEKILV